MAEKNVTVIGVGRLGLGLALLIEKGGYNVCGVDVVPDYVKSLNEKTYKTNEPEYEDILNNSSRFHATTSLEEGVNFSDILFIVVPTPNGGGKNFYDHSILSNLLCKLNKMKLKNKHLIVGCTVMPGYLDTIGESLISDCENTSLDYNPEFIAQGEIIKGFLNPDIILIGTKSLTLGDKLKEVYSSFVHSSPKYCILKPVEAEIVKIGINGFITTKIAYANMIGDLCENKGADKNAVLHSIGGDSRIGNKYFRPGYSFGGPCFPRDTEALQQVLQQNNVSGSLLEGTRFMNQKHVEHQGDQLLREAKDVYIIEDICYKENSVIPIVEESAKLKIADYLVSKGAKVVIKDVPHMLDEVKKEYGNIFNYQSK